MAHGERTRRRDEWKGLLAEDRDFLKGIVQGAVQEILEAEMTEAVQAGKHERTDQRLAYRSGYYPRTLMTRVGTLELRVPQDREGRFSTEVFERYQRSEKALVCTLAEIYVQGVSTRKVEGDYRAALWPQCQCVDGESGPGGTRRALGAVCRAPAGGSLSVPGVRRAL
jgi:transposase-like protein